MIFWLLLSGDGGIASGLLDDEAKSNIGYLATWHFRRHLTPVAQYETLYYEGSLVNNNFILFIECDVEV